MDATRKRAVNGCIVKVRYDSRRIARAGAKQVLGKRGYPLREYLCPFCEGWHLTRQMDLGAGEGVRGAAGP